MCSKLGYGASAGSSKKGHATVVAAIVGVRIGGKGATDDWATLMTGGSVGRVGDRSAT